MSGRVRSSGAQLGGVHHDHDANPKHHHVIFETEDGNRGYLYDPRRFGLWSWLPRRAFDRLRYLGPETLCRIVFNGLTWRARLKGKKSAIKIALRDQTRRAGLANIYVCEALFRAGISPAAAQGASP